MSTVRWLLAVAEIYHGGAGTDAARIGGSAPVPQRLVLGRVELSAIARSLRPGPSKSPGRPTAAPMPSPGVSADQPAGPRALRQAQHPVPHRRFTLVRWRLVHLAQWIFGEFGLSLSETTASGELKRLGS